MSEDRSAMSSDARSLPELIEALAHGDYLAGYEAAGIVDPNCQGREKTNEGKDAERALELYVRTHVICERLAAEGDAVAQAWLALTYQCALGRDPNIELAIHWYERAFEGGQYIVAISLATLFIHAAEGKRDIRKAQFWYDRAKEHGCAFIRIPGLE